MYDFHIHSNYTIKGNYSMEEMVKAAIEKNLKSICFTDQIELESGQDKVDLAFRPKDYFRSINQVKYKYQDKIQVMAGAEIGYQEHLKKRYQDLIQNHNFDYIVLSIEEIQDKPLSSQDLRESLTSAEILEDYYQAIYQALENFDDFDVLCQLDRIDYYIQEDNLAPLYQPIEELLIEILQLLIKKGKGLELNSLSMKNTLSPSPKKSLLKLYKELGGEIISIGSNSYEPNYIGYGYKEMERGLRELGFKYIYIYKDRKKVPIQIAQ